MFRKVEGICTLVLAHPSGSGFHPSPPAGRGRLGTRPSAYQPLDLRGFDGTTKKSALRGIKTVTSDEPEHLVGLDAFGTNLDLQGVREIGNGLHDEHSFALTSYIGDERPIDFDLGERHSVEFRERRH